MNKPEIKVRAADLKRATSPMGNVVWTAPDGTSVMWGPGGGLVLCIPDAFTPGGDFFKIDHPTADGQYATRREAEKALLAFLNVQL